MDKISGQLCLYSQREGLSQPFHGLECKMLSLTCGEAEVKDVQLPGLRVATTVAAIIALKERKERIFPSCSNSLLFH
jgi:hypothetical protein